MHSLSFLQRTYFILTLASSSTFVITYNKSILYRKITNNIVDKSTNRCLGKRVILQIIILLLIKQTAMTIPLLELLENPAKWQQRRIERLTRQDKVRQTSNPRTRFPSSKERASFSLSPSVFCLFFAQARALCITCNQSHLVPQHFSRRKKKI
jgi:hypothetical protein